MGEFDDRYDESYSTRMGNMKKSILNFSKLETPVSWYVPVEGNNVIDIVPYIIKTNKHPLVHKGKKKIGSKDYVLDLFVHERIGIQNNSVVCLRNYNERCPICEAAMEYRNNGKMNEFNTLKAKRYVFYNVINRQITPPQLKVFSTKFALFERELIEEAKSSPEAMGKYVDFANPETGKTIRFRGSMVQLGQIKYLSFKGFQFLDRNYTLTKLIPQAISFDEYIDILSYNEILAMLNSIDMDDTSDIEETNDEATIVPNVENEIPPFNANEKEMPPAFDKVVVEQHSEPVAEPQEITCPYNHKFGIDHDNTPDCDTCLTTHTKIWKKCAQHLPF